MKNVLLRYIGKAAFIVMAGLTVFSCSDDDESDNAIPTVETVQATNVTVTTAELGGIVSGGGNSMMARGVCYGKYEHPEITGDKTTVLKGNGSFSSIAYELEHNTTYYYRAYVAMPEEVIYGEEFTFKTLALKLPEVITGELANVSSTSVTLKGKVISDGGFSLQEQGVCWSTSPAPTLENQYIGKPGAIGDFEIEVDNLLRNTTYYVRAYAKTDAGVAFGEEKSFTTLNLREPELSVVTIDNENVGMFSVKASATITNLYGSDIIEKGFCWSVSPNPVNTGEHLIVSGDGVDLSAELKSLKAYTTYYIRAYAVTLGGTGYSEEVMVKTKTLETDWVTVTPAVPFLMGWCYETDGNKSANAFVGRNTNSDPLEVTMNPYKIGKYEVTNREFAAFMNLYGSDVVKSGNNEGQNIFFGIAECKISKSGNNWVVENGYEEYPVVGVTWYGANEFCLFYGASLPNEAQWECAARGGTTNKYSGSMNADEVAWNSENSGGALHEKGTKAANEYGIYDMSGNVAEWLFDWYDTYSAVYDPDNLKPGKNNDKGLRGGSYDKKGDELRCMHRSTLQPEKSRKDVGFRICLSN